MDIASLFPTLHQLRHFATAESKSAWLFHASFTHKWHFEGGEGTTRYHDETSAQCKPEMCIVLVALEYGLYEFWPTNSLDDEIREMILHLVEMSLAHHWLRIDWNGHSYTGGPPFDRLLRSLATCLADGTSANSLMPVHGRHVNFSIWQNLVWKSIVTRSRSSPALVWLLFLLHGADRSFTLSFEKSCNFSGIDKSGKLVLITGRWGPDQQQIHSPIFCHEGQGGILDLGKHHTWSLSLKELTYLWFEPHADKFRNVYELHENDADDPTENLKELRRQVGMDPEFWQTQVCDDSLPLMGHECEGYTWILELFDSSGE